MAWIYYNICSTTVKTAHFKDHPVLSTTNIPGMAWNVHAVGTGGTGIPSTPSMYSQESFQNIFVLDYSP